jgi:hypothetical protein
VYSNAENNNTSYRIARMILAEEWITSPWSERPALFREPAKLLWSKECGWWWW